MVPCLQGEGGPTAARDSVCSAVCVRGEELAVGAGRLAVWVPQGVSQIEGPVVLVCVCVGVLWWCGPYRELRLGCLTTKHLFPSGCWPVCTLYKQTAASGVCLPHTDRPAGVSVVLGLSPPVVVEDLGQALVLTCTHRAHLRCVASCSGQAVTGDTNAVSRDSCCWRVA